MLCPIQQGEVLIKFLLLETTDNSFTIFCSYVKLFLTLKRIIINVCISIVHILQGKKKYSKLIRSQYKRLQRSKA